MSFVAGFAASFVLGWLLRSAWLARQAIRAPIRKADYWQCSECGADSPTHIIPRFCVRCQGGHEVQWVPRFDDGDA